MPISPMPSCPREKKSVTMSSKSKIIFSAGDHQKQERYVSSFYKFQEKTMKWQLISTAAVLAMAFDNANVMAAYYANILQQCSLNDATDEQYNTGSTTAT